MCGIVCYYGGAGNNLTRVLTGMSSIIYRAPDSTGVGVFGDDAEPIRIRKTVGAVDQLIDELQDNMIYPCPEAVLTAMLESGSDSDQPLPAQKQLLLFEGLTTDHLAAIQSGRDTYPNFDELVELAGDHPRRLSPGWPGRSQSIPDHTVSSKKDLANLIQHLIRKYDLSPIVIQAIIRKALRRSIERHPQLEHPEVTPKHILDTFDEVFDTILAGERLHKPQRVESARTSKGPYVQRYLWRYLVESTIHIPADYDRDGVRCVFRLLDAALLCRLPFFPEIGEQLQQILDSLWPVSQRPAGIQWRSLYGIEKGVNVYGWAAAAAVIYLQREEFLSAYLKTQADNLLIEDKAIVPGRTDPVTLRYFTQPVLAHGRWAIQSAVTAKNAHPFTDARRQRTIVLNGQFDSQVEEQLRNFLATVAGMSFRSENSSECFALLWGYYFDRLKAEQIHIEDIRRQVDSGMSRLGIGSQSIDMGMQRKVMDKTPVELDKMALVEAARKIAAAGGQIAAAAISLVSPRTLYVVSHNRPVFVVQRLENDDFMVVSDINAAMGLFPQTLIYEKQLELHTLTRSYRSERKRLKSSGASAEDLKSLQTTFSAEKKTLLEAFRVAVYPLDGELILACIQAVLKHDGLARNVCITDFEGQALPDIEPFVTDLDPVQVRRDFRRSFHETHLKEIPDRLNDILRYYQRGEGGLPDFNLHKKFLRRRFGTHFGGLKRLVIIGTGSSLHMGKIVQPFLRSLQDDIDILLIRPGEVSDWSRIIAPQNDLVILLSWSSTTADMVKTAKSLLELQIVMIAVTEKIYSDMALLAHKSGGVIPILSGEEVTVSAIKSTVCMLYCLYLFGLWLADARQRHQEARAVLADIQHLPDWASQVLQNKSTLTVSKALARQYADCRAVIVIDSDKSCGTGREIALKLEENSWTAIGKTYDYQDVPEIEGTGGWHKCLVIVNACCLERLDEAVAVMAGLNRQGIDFMAVTVANRLEEQIRDYSRGQCVLLPRLPEILQAMAVLLFFYRFAFDFGRAHGRQIGVPPRNRAKSLTVSRSLEHNIRTQAEQLLFLKNWNDRAAEAGDLSGARDAPSHWERQSGSGRALRYFEAMRGLAGMLAAENSLEQMLVYESGMLEPLQRALFSEASEVQELLFIPLDRPSEAAARNMADHLEFMFDYPVRIVFRGEAAVVPAKSALSIILSTRQPEQQTVNNLLDAVAGPLAWIGLPPSSSRPAGLPDRVWTFSSTQKSFDPCRGDLLYSIGMLLFIRLWQSIAPTKAGVVNDHFKMAARIIRQVLDSPTLLEDINQAVADNAAYSTAFFIGPARGSGPAWVDCFDRIGSLMTEYHDFGQSSHGPIVTVDPRVDKKFVRLTSAARMAGRFGSDVLAGWEKTYLNGKSVDTFLQNPSENQNTAWQRPFFAGDRWYLPVLKPEYNTRDDNLIIIDAGSERYLSQSIDELSTFGCRYPRMIAIVQEPLMKTLRESGVFRFPYAGMFRIPAAAPDLAWSEMHLPLAVNLIAMAMATAVKGSE